MTRLGQMLVKEGITQGKERQTVRYNRLILRLAEDGKSELIVKAAANPELLERLFEEYDISQ